MLSRSRQIFFVGSVSNPYGENLLGGELVTIQQARTLRNWGYSSFVVTAMGRLESLRIRGPRDPLYIRKSDFERLIHPDIDVVVVPGRHLQRLNSIPGDNKILFSQGAYITLAALDFYPHSENPWKNPTIKGIFCVSHGNAELIQTISGGQAVSVIPPFISSDDHAKVHARKSASIVFPALRRPEKNPLDTTAVLHLICAKLRNCNPQLLQRLQLIELTGLSHTSVLDILQNASILLFLGNNEGLPLLVLEALSNNVITLGFNRKSLSDVLHPRCSFEIGQLEHLANTAVSILERPDEWNDIRIWGRAKADSYSERAHLSALCDAWSLVETAISSYR